MTLKLRLGVQEDVGSWPEDKHSLAELAQAGTRPPQSFWKECSFCWHLHVHLINPVLDSYPPAVLDDVFLLL